MLTFPNAKINIGLFITNKREDGYHDLETVFYPVKELKDALEVVVKVSPFDSAQDDMLRSAQGDMLRSAKDDSIESSLNDKTNIHVSGLSVAGSAKNNLVWKAYELLQNRFPEKIPALEIYLNKAIPMGAGLGGGSADGAFMLRLLNDFCELNLSNEEMATMSLELGSDCPFFIYNTPQFATGRGEKLQSLSLDLSAFDIKIVTPKIHVSTKDAFAMLTPKAASFDLRKLDVKDIAHWKDYVINDFEEPIFRQYPELKKIKQQFYDDGAVYASMSGSGSAVYGLFEKK